MTVNRIIQRLLPALAIIVGTNFVLGTISQETAHAAGCSSVTTRWASSSNSIYLNGPGSCTLPELKAKISQHAPINVVDEENNIWFIGANIRLEDGAKLKIYGTAAGGTVDELRLKSDNTGNAHDFIFLRAHWGEYDIRNTEITSWDSAVNGPDTNHSNGRAFIHVRSILDTDGVTPLESRLDITASEIHHLGYYAAESYGLVWKVLGYEPNLFDKSDVYGDVTDSYIHHNYFGAYTYGAYGMNWKNNEIAYNIAYGLDPHDDSDYLVIEGNNIHHNGDHGLICSKRCNNLVIKNNTVDHNAGNGIMLHRAVIDSVVEGNITRYNDDTGIAIFDSSNNIIRNNTSKFNTKNGIRFSVEGSHNTIEDNDFSDNKQYGVFMYKGSDDPLQGNGRPQQNYFKNNTINDNEKYAVKLKQADYNIFEQNTFNGNEKGVYLYLDQPYGNEFLNNDFDDNGDYSIKLNATNTFVEDNNITNSKYGVLLHPAVGTLVSGNTFSDVTYGIQLRNSHDTTVFNNIVDGADKAIYLRDGSTNNHFADNTLKNGKYPFYMLDSDNNSYENNILQNNSRNYYYAKQNSINNTIINPIDVSAKIRDSVSNIELTHDGNIVWDNNKNIPTDSDQNESSLNLKRSITGSVVHFDAIELEATPASGSIETEPISWSSTTYKKWETDSNSNPDVTFKVGDLKKNSTFDVEADGSSIGTFTSNGAGEIQFTYDDGFSSPVSFEVSLD